MAWLRNFLEEKLADVNPWDNGRTGATVRAERSRPRPAATPPPNQPRVMQNGAVAQQSFNQRQNQLSQTVRSRVKQPSFTDYLNPFGTHGLFGSEQQELFTDVTKPIVGALEGVQNKIDSTDKHQGFQWNSGGDYARFGAKLLPGMAQGVVEAPRLVGEGVSGQRVRDGQVENLNPIQRVGTLGDAYLSSAGLVMGASGKLLSGLGVNIGEKAAAPVVNGFRSTLLDLSKSALKEGAEETAQTGFQDLSDDGLVNTRPQDYLQAAALGTLGGGAMHGAGIGINAGRRLAIDQARTIPGRAKGQMMDMASAESPTINARLDFVEGNNKVLDQKRVKAYERELLNSRQTRPVVVTPDENGVLQILDGDHRLAAYRNLGVDFIPTKTVSPSQLDQAMTAFQQMNKTAARRLVPGGTLDAPLNPKANIDEPLANLKQDALDGKDTRVARGADTASEVKVPQAEPTSSIEEYWTGKPLDDKIADEYIREQVASFKGPDDFANDIVDRIWANNKTGKGVDTTLLRDDPRSNDITGRMAVSNNSPLYQAFYKEHGRKPTKREIKELVEQELSGEPTILSGQQEMSPYDADIYKQLAERQTTPLPETHGFDDPYGYFNSPKPLETTPKSKRYNPSKTIRQAEDDFIAGKISADKLENIREADAKGITPKKQLPPAKTATPETIQGYIDQQIKAQQAETKVPRKQRLENFTDNAKHMFVDDAVAYQRYIKDKPTRSAIQEGVDRVRNSSIIAKQFVEDNNLDSIGRLNGDDLNQFQQYLIAKRAIELETRDVKTGRDIGMDKALIKQTGGKFAEQEKAFRDYTHAMLDYSVDNGLISKELRDKLLKDSPNYVPMNRVMDEIADSGMHKSKQLGNLGKQSVVQKIKGSERTVENPIESIILNTERMINEAERNKVAKWLTGSDAFKENILKGDQKPRTGYDTVSLLDNGKKVSYEVPALVAKEMKNLNGVMPDWYNTMIKVVGAPTRMLRTGATSANPIFAVSNVVRDQLQTTVTGNLRANLRGTPKALIAAFDPGERGQRLRAELQRNGIMGSQYRQTYGYKSGELMKELQAQNQLSKAAMNRIKEPLGTLADVIGTTEAFTRAQQFYGTKGDLTTRSQAARNNTLNFSRGGVVTRELNKIIPFLNAGVQGGRVLVNTGKDRPVRTAVALTSITGIALAVRAQNEAQNKELYERLSAEEKKNNLIVFTPGAHYDPEQNRVVGVVKIPMPQMVYPLLDAANNVKGKPEDILRIAGDIITAGTGIDTTNPISQLTPTFVKPAAEIGLNKSFYTGQDVVSEYEKNEAPEDMGKKYTSGLARSLAGATGMPAPWVDNIVGNLGGGLAKDLVKAFTDNPDSTKDGKGLAGTFEEGFGRRFGSAYVTSQYDIQEGLAKDYKAQLEKSDGFTSLSRDEQVKILDKIDYDTKAIAGIAAKTEQGRSDEIKRDMTDRQRNLVENGFNPGTYLKDVASAGNNVKISDAIGGKQKETLTDYNSMTKEERDSWFNEVPSAEYEYELARYENDKANGTLSKAENIRRQKDVAKAKVGADYPKEIRELYGLSKSDFYNLITTDPDGNRIAEQALAYGDALEAAGLADNKFRLKNGAVSFGDASGSGGGGGRKRKTGSSSNGLDYSKMFAFSDPTSTTKSLRQLLAEAMVK